MSRIHSRIIVELDNLASEMLRAHLANDPEDDPRDVVNAATYFYLADPDADHRGIDLSCGDQALGYAKQNRLACEQKPVDQRLPAVQINLDDVAARLLARFVRKSGLDGRDVANGAIVCLLQAILDDHSETSGECIAAAKTRRLAVKQREVS